MGPLLFYCGYDKPLSMTFRCVDVVCISTKFIYNFMNSHVDIYYSKEYIMRCMETMLYIPFQYRAAKAPESKS